MELTMKSTSPVRSLVAAIAMVLCGSGTVWAQASLADSNDGWSPAGTQGENNWFWGYYNLTLDPDATYAPADFTPFLYDGTGVVSADNHWNGSYWDLTTAASAPWTELGRGFTHPSGPDAAPFEEHWPIARWVSDRAVAGASIDWRLWKTNANCGNGVTGLLFVNGLQLDTAAINGTDAIGVVRGVTINLQAGDIIDLAISPVGPDAARNDGCDGSGYRLTIGETPPDEDGDGTPDAGDNCRTVANAGQANADADPYGDVCDFCPNVAEVIQRDGDGDGIGDLCDPDTPRADSVVHWSYTGTQGERNWFNGYYIQTLDVDGLYDPSTDFIPFLNGGGDIDPLTNHWNGSLWDLSTAAGPWTELAQENTHPNGSNSAPGEEHWTIRRWVSDVAQTAAITYHVRKTNPNGTGVTARLFFNGGELDQSAIDGDDVIGTTRTVYEVVAVGDIIEVALDPTGPTGDRGDGADGSATRLSIGDIPDTDGDGVLDHIDNCRLAANPGQANGDADALGDACDNCPALDSLDQNDHDRDGLGDACDADLADSFRDWSTTGEQAEKSWLYGYYNRTLDPDGTYSGSEFELFTNEFGAAGGPAIPDGNHWIGTAWALTSDPGATGGPWTYLDKEDTHPNGTNSNPFEEHWTVRRWEATKAAKVLVTWHVRKANPNGSGVTGLLFHNGVEVDAATIPGQDSIGLLRKLVLDVKAGDAVDLALAPGGLCGGTDDGADGSVNWLNISESLPATTPPTREILADSSRDWSPSGTQGEAGWSYGYYDQRADVTAGDGKYSPAEFIPFLNDGSNVISPTNHWNGGGWDLVNNGPIGRGPWVELGCGGGHPSGNSPAGTDVHWAVRRWTSAFEGDLEAEMFALNGGAGDGVVLRVLHNGVELAAMTTDGLPARATVSIPGVKLDDVIDFAMDSDGAGNLAKSGIDAVTDGSDGTATTFTMLRQKIVVPPGATFRRGDADANGSLELTDAVNLLNYLFLGAANPACIDAADFDDNGEADISDAIASLNYQFLGGAPPAAPGVNECGRDVEEETPDLGCDVSC